MIDFDAKKRQGFMARLGYIKVQCEGPGPAHSFEIHEVNAEIIRQSGKPIICPKCQKSTNTAKVVALAKSPPIPFQPVLTPFTISGTPEEQLKIPTEHWGNFLTALYMVTALEHLWFKDEKFPVKYRDLKKLVGAGF